MKFFFVKTGIPQSTVFSYSHVTIVLIISFPCDLCPHTSFWFNIPNMFFIPSMTPRGDYKKIYILISLYTLFVVALRNWEFDFNELRLATYDSFFFRKL